MNYTLQNHSIGITVSTLGAELQSLTSSTDGEEFLWQGDQNIWEGRAPILFPIVGSLKDSRMSHNGQSYSLPRHGPARKQQFSCVKEDESHLLFSLSSNAETLLTYPWNFTLEVGFSLSGNRLEISYTVIHTGTDAQGDMLFSIGSHPGFRLPVDETPLKQFDIRFSHTERLQQYRLDENGILSTQGQHYPLTDNRIVLHKTIFDHDALVFKDIRSDTISLWQQGHERVRVNTGGAPHLGVWAKPGAPYVCIEPWYGYSDAADATGVFAQKPAMLSLAEGQSFRTDWSIELPSVQR